MAESLLFVGIDVSKSGLDVATRPGEVAFRVANDPAGTAELVERLRPLSPALVVLEATGGYESTAVAALQAARIPVAAIDPRQARDFAKATGRLAKTDRIDAEALAHFAEAIRPEPRPGDPPEREALAAAESRRRQLVEMRVMESNRLATCRDAAVRGGIERHLAWLDAELAEAERLLAEAVRGDAELRRRDELLRSIPGIGPVASRTLLTSLPELGTLDGGRLAALAGLAPYAHDSGTLKGSRHIRGGRADVRRALYLAALSARRSGPLRAFADRLLARGKKAKVVLIAVARKLLTIANAVVRSGLAWDPSLATARAACPKPQL
jgi:transposase